MRERIFPVYIGICNNDPRDDHEVRRQSEKIKELVHQGYRRRNRKEKLLRLENDYLLSQLSSVSNRSIESEW